MPPRSRDPHEPPPYRRYRSAPPLLAPRSSPSRTGRRGGTPTPGGRRLRLTPRRVLLGSAIFLAGWITLSVLLFLTSAHFNRSSPPGGVSAVLDPAGSPLLSANNVLVLGSDQRTKNSHEPGASTSGPSRSDVIMLIRTGGGHAARLSIPRDTVVSIPGHGLQKINAAYAFGGPAEAISVVKRYLGIPINHLVEVNFAGFPALVDAMGGVPYQGGCVISLINGGFRNGGYTLRLSPGSHQLDGQQALALARTRHNQCKPGESDLTRVQRQQKLFQNMEHRLSSPSILLRLPWVSWNAPPALTSDMSGPTLLSLFAALAVGGTTPTRLLTPSGVTSLPDGSVGLSVSPAARRAAVAQFLHG